MIPTVNLSREIGFLARPSIHVLKNQLEHLTPDYFLAGTIVTLFNFVFNELYLTSSVLVPRLVIGDLNLKRGQVIPPHIAQKHHSIKRIVFACTIIAFIGMNFALYRSFPIVKSNVITFSMTGILISWLRFTGCCTCDQPGGDLHYLFLDKGK